MELIDYQNKFKIFINPEDAIVSSQIKNGNRDTKELQMISQFVKKDDIVMDLGAHIGFISLHLSQMVGSNGIVYAFEPSKFNYNYLLENIKINNYKNIIPFNVAIAEKARKGYLYLAPKIKNGKSNTGDHRIYDIADRQKEEIDIITLDKFINKHSQKVSFIKIDTQGSEYNILKGAEYLLKTMRPILYFEFWPFGLRENNDDPNAMLQYLTKLGYALFYRNLPFDINQTFGDTFKHVNLFGFPKNSSNL